jgi:uncharacterized protein (UPF0371 family)
MAQKNSIKSFDNEKYLLEQSEEILKQVNKYEKLYLEFGGKLIFDYHASRVLPGFDPNVKMRLLQKLKHRADILICVYSGDIERRKIRADFGITYEADVFKLISDLKQWGLEVSGVVITRFENQPTVKIFKNKLERRGLKVYTHYYTKGYPTDVDLIVSPQGYGANDYIETQKQIVVVTGPGPCSGKLATCLSQLYQDHEKGIKSGYAKFETFPVWNIPLKHPLNMAYEAATADLGDINMIDSFHLDAYGEKTVNYNRDMEIFPVISRILGRIMGSDDVYKSPTDMGVNKVKSGIVNDQEVVEASKQEIIRRYFRYQCEYILGLIDNDTLERTNLLMKELNINEDYRSVVIPARKVIENSGEEANPFGAAIELPDGHIIAKKGNDLLSAVSCLILDSVKYLAKIPDEINLLPTNITQAIRDLKKNFIKKDKSVLTLEEVLIALGISAVTNPTSELAMSKLGELRGCEVHTTRVPSSEDEIGLRNLEVNLTSDSLFSLHEN